MCLTLNNRTNDGATKLVKDETIITLKNGNKGQKSVQKKLILILLGKTKLN
jgi:hypothetical protein